MTAWHTLVKAFPHAPALARVAVLAGAFAAIYIFETAGHGHVIHVSGLALWALLGAMAGLLAVLSARKESTLLLSIATRGGLLAICAGALWVMSMAGPPSFIAAAARPSLWIVIVLATLAGMAMQFFDSTRHATPEDE